MSKEMFRTAYGERARHFAPVGKETQEIWSHEINKHGQKVLVITGETNIYDKIQASAEESKIENILAAVTNGDTNKLRPDGIYADISEVPNNLVESMQQIQNLQNIWSELPNDIKEKYNWNVEEFVGASGTDRWLVDMGLIKQEEPKAEIKAEAPKATKKGETEE